ncbi:dr1-associated corepressor-like [Branchiostoma floridae]|uniref:Dr1-associated corepressor n=1 Tax=Branchiostoma floridae TaxID=7739 RepID=A0A9J7M6Y8_BRAFL|nr:dr1-associated corepressor-like [Branchiostoma floridae]
MPSKKKKYNARFPPARIKKIMQTDEDVGKVAAAVPVIISRCLEIFVESLVTKASDVTRSRNAKTMTTAHLKRCIETENQFDFLKDLVEKVPDVGEDSGGREVRNSDDNAAQSRPRQRRPRTNGGRKRGRRKSSEEEEEEEEEAEEESDIDMEDDQDSTSQDSQPLNLSTSSATHLTVPVMPSYTPSTSSGPPQRPPKLGEPAVSPAVGAPPMPVMPVPVPQMFAAMAPPTSTSMSVTHIAPPIPAPTANHDEDDDYDS